MLSIYESLNKATEHQAELEIELAKLRAECEVLGYVTPDLSYQFTWLQYQKEINYHRINDYKYQLRIK